MWTSFCSLEAKAIADLRTQFRLRRPDSVTSLDPAFLERMASLKVHVKDEVRFQQLRQCNRLFGLTHLDSSAEVNCLPETRALAVLAHISLDCANKVHWVGIAYMFSKHKLFSFLQLGTSYRSSDQHHES